MNDTISVELKAIIELEDVHLAQAMNYLEAYNLEVGLLINFGARSLEFKRIIASSLLRKKTDLNLLFRLTIKPIPKIPEIKVKTIGTPRS